MIILNPNLKFEKHVKCLCTENSSKYLYIPKKKKYILGLKSEFLNLHVMTNILNVLTTWTICGAIIAPILAEEFAQPMPIFLNVDEK